MTPPDIAVSVVLPVFNGEKFLDEAITSIRNQTFSHFEFIIINDGSTDQSIEIIKRHAASDPRIVVVDRENKGLVATLNEGVRLASSDLIARMDADDIAEPDRLMVQYEFMEKNAKVVAAGTAYLLVDERGNPIRKFFPATTNSALQQQALQRATPICHPTAIFRKSAFQLIGGYQSNAMLAEDLDLWLRMGEVGDLANVKKILLKYRQHSGSISESKQLKQLEVIDSVVREAYVRRGIEIGNNLKEAMSPWRSTGSKADNFSQILKYGWWAWSDGYVPTARVYAIKAMRHNILSLESWKLLYCVWFRKAPII